MSITNNIYPVNNHIILRGLKEKLLKQSSKVIWLTGLSGSGKTTIAMDVEKILFNNGFLTQVLDGDNIRDGINKNLGFSDDDRTENIRRIAEISKLFLNCGIITINGFISPTRKIRDMAKSIIGEKDFFEVYINSSLEICEKRDIKGLYHLAREGKIKDFTGIDSPYEPPENPFLEIKSDKLSIEESVNMLVNSIFPFIKL
jgi:adenylylsulfate kinase